MADSKISGLSEDTTPSADDLLVTVNDPAGTPANKKVTVANLDTFLSATTKTLTNKTLTSPKINEDVAVTATATEINYTDGVTSAIQTQLDGKQATITDASLSAGRLEATGPTVIGKVSGTGSAVELTVANLYTILGITATAAEVNYIDGVTSAIQTQLDGKQPLDSDLTAIAGLTATTDNFMVATASAWASRTPTQARTQLGLGALATLATVGTSQIDDAAVTLAKMANLAQDQFIGRTTASTGVPQTATITSAARTVLDDTTVDAMINTLGGATAEGTGAIIRKGSPTITTPNLGTPSALVLTNATGLVNAGLSTAAGELGAAWVSWTPTLTTITIGNGTLACKYSQRGKTIHGRFQLTFGTTTSMGTGKPTFTLPVTSVSLVDTLAIGTERHNAGGVLGLGQIQWASTTTGRIVHFLANGTYVTEDQFTSGGPGTWANGSTILGTFTYEAA